MRDAKNSNQAKKKISHFVTFSDVIIENTDQNGEVQDYIGNGWSRLHR